MRAFITTLASSLGEERNKTIQDLKRQIFLMKEENIKLFNEKTYLKEDSKKAFKTEKILMLCFKKMTI